MLLILLCIVDLVYVQPNHRGKGLGKALLAHCIQEASYTNCSRIEWIVLNWNQRAIDLYKSIGAQFPDDDVWKLMRMDQSAIENYIRTCQQDT